MATELTKPAYRDPCNGCGLCCKLELCVLAESIFPGAVAPCPALEWEDGRAWCGMVRHPSRHLGLNFNFPISADTVTIAENSLRAYIAEGLGIGLGCGMEDGPYAIDDTPYSLDDVKEWF